jgi:t-SNARE complex subunit (syntaxin)
MKKTSAELAKSLEDLRAEVKELREMVNMLVDLVINMDHDDAPDYETDFMDFGSLQRDQRFSM